MTARLSPRTLVKALMAMCLGFTLVLGLTWTLSWQPATAQAGPMPQAAVLYVAVGGACNATPCYASVQEAVDHAATGDEIRVAAGTYGGVSARKRNDYRTTGLVTQTLYISKTITVRGGYSTADWSHSYPLTQPTRLDAGGLGRVVYITGRSAPTLDGLTVTGGNAAGQAGDVWDSDAGGGLYEYNSAPIIRNCTVISNSALRGAGIIFYAGSPSLAGSTVMSNTAGHSSGGLFMLGTNAEVTANSFVSNTATAFGGGVGIHGSTGQVRDNIIAGNRALRPNEGSGGGIQMFENTTLVTGNTIRDNYAFVGGGAALRTSQARLMGNRIYSNTAALGAGLNLEASSATIEGNEIAGNAASISGGGLSIGFGTNQVAGNVIRGNTAGGSGGGMSLNGSAVEITNNAVIDNLAGTTGSAMDVQRSTPRLVHNTLARNHGGDGTAVSVMDLAGTYSTVMMTNTILADQALGISAGAGNTVTLAATLWYSTGQKFDGAGTIVPGSSTDGDPAFAADGFHITDSSAAKKLGVPTGLFTDIDREARPAIASDLGADQLWFARLYMPLLVGGSVPPGTAPDEMPR